MRRKIRAWFLYHFFQPRNIEELMDTAGSLFPYGGQVEEDLDGQLMLYTGLTCWMRPDGEGGRVEELSEINA